MNNALQHILAAVTGTRGDDAPLEELAALVDLPVEELRSIPADPRFCYRPLTIRKRSGGKRHIAAPSSPLKHVQRRLLHRYLAHQPIHDAATAYRAGASIATHARRHLGQTILLLVDLTDFFPSTAAWRVRRWFGNLGWQGESLHILMRLCVYRGGLPQGAPTSPALSNLVNRPLDEALSRQAAMSGARYSRYCDDIAFSWGTDAEPPAFRREVADTLGRFGYQVHPVKGWRLQHVDRRPEITGVVLDGRRLRLPAAVLARIRRLLFRRFFLNATERSQLQGYIGLRKMLK